MSGLLTPIETTELSLRLNLHQYYSSLTSSPEAQKEIVLAQPEVEGSSIRRKLQAYQQLTDVENSQKYCLSCPEIGYDGMRFFGCFN